MPQQPTDRFDPERFECAVEPDRDAVRIVPSGALDIATVPILEARLLELRKSGFRRVLVDLRQLQFIDSTGLRLLLAQDAEARQDGFSFGLIPGSPKVQRLFELTDTLDVLSFVDP
jgi:anti-sigma B factor antagonist